MIKIIEIPITKRQLGFTLFIFIDIFFFLTFYYHVITLTDFIVLIIIMRCMNALIAFVFDSKFYHFYSFGLALILKIPIKFRWKK
jgi:hypothetical protein